MNRALSAANSDSTFNSRPSSAGNAPGSASRIEDQSLVDSKNSRIAQRKSRIEAARQAKLKPQQALDSEKKKTKNTLLEISPSQSQINSSIKHLENVKVTGLEAVTNIRVAADARASLRRFEERKKMEAWKDHRKQDASFEKERMSNIDGKWGLADTMNHPHDLRNLMEVLKKECDALIDNKNKLIAEYMAELKSKDDDYVKELKRQTEEIDSLLQRMRGQYKNYQSTVRSELDLIEKAFMAERSSLLEEQMKELSHLQNQRRSDEGKNLEEKAKKLEDAIKSLEDLRVRDSEDYNLVKIKLETDVQVLEQQLQQMRATYQLNTEKLEYNYQVLKKRDDENMIVINHQKRKITKSTDIVNSLKAKLSTQEQNYQMEYQNLSEEYKRITEQVKHLQKKFKHFQTADQKRFQEIWSMNEEEVKTLMRKVLQADQIIHEQQLGLPWKAPLEDLHYFGLENGGESRKPDSSALAIGMADPVGKLYRMDGKRLLPVESEIHEKQHQSNLEIPILASQELAFSSKASTKQSQQPMVLNLSEKVQASSSYQGFSTPVKKILGLLCNEAGFLVEDKLNKLLNPLSQDERALMRLDAIFKALGLETLEDVKRLSSYFIKPDAVQPSTSDISADPEKAYGSLLIDPNDAVKAMKRFLADSKALKAGTTNGNKRQSVIGSSSNRATPISRDSLESSDQDSQQVAKRSNSDLFKITLETGDLNASLKAQKAYWDRATAILSDDNYKLWKSVYQEMVQYHKLLNERWQLHEETQSIRAQNEEMKNLLRQYLTAKVNEELQIPPTKVLLGQ